MSTQRYQELAWRVPGECKVRKGKDESGLAEEIVRYLGAVTV